MNWINGAFKETKLSRWEYLGASIAVPAIVSFIGGFLDGALGIFAFQVVGFLVAIFASCMATYNRVKTVGMHGAWTALVFVPFVSLVLIITILVKDEKVS